MKRAKRQSLTPTEADDAGNSSFLDAHTKPVMKKQKLDDGSAVGSAPLKTPLQKLCKDVLSELKKYTDTSGRLVASLFLELPSRKLYPDYYMLIREPVSIACIESKQYEKLDDFKSDLKKMFDNARTYNQEGSAVYEDANILEKFTYELIEQKKSMKKKPHKDDVSVLFEAIEKGDAKVVGDVLKRGVDVNVMHETNIFGEPFSWTPLNCAAYYGRPKVIHVLMQNGAKLEMVDSTYQGTALAWAAFNNQFKAASVLVKDFQARKDVTNADGLTPYDLLSPEAHENAQWLDILVDEKPLIVPQDFDEQDFNSPQVMTVIYDYLVKLRDTTGRRYSDIFMDLPSRKEYPSYYTVIKQPIAFKLIAKRIQLDYYETIDDFMQDLQLMFENAQQFNPAGSFVHEDAKYLQKIATVAQFAAKKSALKRFLAGESKDLEEKVLLKLKTSTKPKVTIKLPTASSVESLHSSSSGIENRDSSNWRNDEESRSKFRRRSAPPPRFGDDLQHISEDDRRASYSAAELQRQALAAQYNHHQQQQQQQQTQTFVKVDGKGDYKRLPMIERVEIYTDDSEIAVFKPTIGRHGMSLSLPRSVESVKAVCLVNEEVDDQNRGFQHALLQNVSLNFMKLPPTETGEAYSLKLEPGSNVFEIVCTAQVDESYAVANWNPQLNRYVQVANGPTVKKTRELRQSFSIVLVRL